MAGKQFPLSIVVRTVDQATAGLRRINDRVQRLGGPIRRLNRSFSGLSRAAGLPQIADSFRGVGREVGRLTRRLGLIAGAAGLGVAGLKALVDQGDELAKLADRVGLSVDSLAQLRFAAQQSGTETNRFNRSIEALAKRVGELKAGSGALFTLLKKTSPALLEQLQAAEGTEEAFDILVEAMDNLEDPTKRAALAAAAFSRSGLSLLNLFAQGRRGIDELRREYFELAGSQEDSARKSELVADAMGRVKAAAGGVRAAILTGLAPAFLDVAEKMKSFLVDHRDDIARWAKDFGEKLPGRVAALVEAFKTLIRFVGNVVEAMGGLENAIKIVGAVMLIPLVASIVKAVAALKTIGIALGAVAAVIGTAVFFAFQALFALIAAHPFLALIAAAVAIVKFWEPLKAFFVALWDGIKKVFSEAWDFIKGIVDKIVGAVDTVIGAGSRVVDFVTGREELGIGDFVGQGQMDRALMGSTSTEPREARVSVAFENAPRGTRVERDRGGDAEVDLSVGFQLGDS